MYKTTSSNVPILLIWDFAKIREFSINPVLAVTGNLKAAQYRIIENAVNRSIVLLQDIMNNSIHYVLKSEIDIAFNKGYISFGH